MLRGFGDDDRRGDIVVAIAGVLGIFIIVPEINLERTFFLTRVGIFTWCRREDITVVVVVVIITLCPSGVIVRYVSFTPAKSSSAVSK